MKALNILVMLALSLVFFSCRKDRDIVEEPKAPETMEELQVPASFNWKTTTDFRLTIVASAAGIVHIQNDAGISYQKVYITANQPYTTKLTLPAYEKRATIVLNDTHKIIDLSSPVLTIQF